MSGRKVYAVKRGCTVCGTCMTGCPTDAISVAEMGAMIDQSLCSGCGVCARNCPSEAIVEVAIENQMKGNDHDQA